MASDTGVTPYQRAAERCGSALCGHSRGSHAGNVGGGQCEFVDVSGRRCPCRRFKVVR